MIKTIIVVALVSILYGSSVSYAAWSEEKIARQICFTVTAVNDWHQTRSIAVLPQYEETNRILGKHPTLTSVNTYFASCIVGHALIAYLLPEDYARVWQNVWIGVQSNQVGVNYGDGLAQGVGMEFRVSHSITF